MISVDPGSALNEIGRLVQQEKRSSPLEQLFLCYIFLPEYGGWHLFCFSNVHIRAVYCKFNVIELEVFCFLIFRICFRFLSHRDVAGDTHHQLPRRVASHEGNHGGQHRRGAVMLPIFYLCVVNCRNFCLRLLLLCPRPSLALRIDSLVDVCVLDLNRIFFESFHLINY